MKSAFVFAPIILIILCGGCMTGTINPIDISNVKTESELDQYLGKYVSFRGTWQSGKESVVTNGYVGLYQSVYGRYVYDEGFEDIVTGYLRKYVVEEEPINNDQGIMKEQGVPLGNHYSIWKNADGEETEPGVSDCTLKYEKPAGPLRKKLESILLDKVEFEDVPLGEVLNSLKQKSKELDPDKTGVNIILLHSDLPPSANEDKNTIYIYIENVPLFEVIRNICMNCNAQYVVDEKANTVIIYIIPATKDK